MDEKPRVFVIDDDPLVLKAIERMLRANDFAVEAFSSPAAFLDRPPYDGLACLLLDLQMPGLNGLDVQETMIGRGVIHPIIFFSGQGDVPSTARAMREGAIDFLVKPLDEPSCSRRFSGPARGRRRCSCSASPSARSRPGLPD